VGVVELGMNHPGEIGIRANLEPAVALINNAARTESNDVDAVADETARAAVAVTAGHRSVPLMRPVCPCLAAYGRYAHRMTLPCLAADVVGNGGLAARALAGKR
jgi:hypothetical protein